MVLRRPLLTRFALLLPLLATACLKQPDAVQASTVEPVALAGVLTSVDDGVTVAFTEEAMARLAAVVQARNLSPRVVSAPALTERGSGPLRLSLLGASADGASLAVLVEANARFFSQMNGQYRWTVDVQLSLAPKAPPSSSGATSDRFEVPVFLLFDHEAEPEALLGALPVIERRLGALLDQHLVAQGLKGR